MARNKLGKGPGRPKGSANKLTKDIKAAIIEAFEKAGGADYLAKVAKEQPQVFCALLGRVMPLQVTGEGGGPVQVQIAGADASLL